MTNGFLSSFSILYVAEKHRFIALCEPERASAEAHVELWTLDPGARASEEHTRGTFVFKLVLWSHATALPRAKKRVDTSTIVCRGRRKSFQWK